MIRINFRNLKYFTGKQLIRTKQSADAIFNSGDALYKQKKYEDAGKQFAETHKMNEDKDKKSSSLYNLGNSMLMANKFQESIEAYKNSLRLKPDNQEAKYNLAYAQDLLKKQQQQQSNSKIRIIRIRTKIRKIKDKTRIKIKDQKQNDQEKQNNDKDSNSNSNNRISSRFQKRMLRDC